VVAWTVLVSVAAAALLRASSELVQWTPGEVQRATAVVSKARWTMLVACLALALATVIAHRRIGSPIAAALTAGVAAAALITPWIPVPFLAFVVVGLGCWILVAAFVAVLRAALFEAPVP
jgi:uncharacterized membrane protein